MTAIPEETRAVIEREMRELAQRGYPRVWVGEAADMSGDEALVSLAERDERLRETWEDMSDAERRGVWAQVPEHERGGLADPPSRWDDLPKIVREGMGEPLEWGHAETASSEWLPGDWVLENMAPALGPEQFAALDEEALYVRAAKRGLVPVRRHFGPRLRLGLPDVYELVPLERLEAEDADDDLVDALMHHASGGEEGEYVIEDTPEARAAVERRLGEGL